MDYIQMDMHQLNSNKQVTNLKGILGSNLLIILKNSHYYYLMKKQKNLTWY